MNLSIISILLGRAMITAHIAKLDQTRIEISKCQIVRLGVIACRHPLVQHWMAHCAQAADCNSCSCGSNPNNGRWSPYTYIHLIRPKIIGLNIIILLFCNRVFFDTFLNKKVVSISMLKILHIGMHSSLQKRSQLRKKSLAATQWSDRC